MSLSICLCSPLDHGFKVLALVRGEHDLYFTTTPGWQDICNKVQLVESVMDSIVTEVKMLSSLLIAHAMELPMKHELAGLLGPCEYQQKLLLNTNRLSTQQSGARGRLTNIRSALEDILVAKNTTPLTETSVQKCPAPHEMGMPLSDETYMTPKLKQPTIEAGVHDAGMETVDNTTRDTPLQVNTKVMKSHTY